MDRERAHTTRCSLVTLAALLCFIALSPSSGVAQSAAEEIRSTVEAMLKPSTQPRIAPEQVIHGLIQKHGRGIVSDVAFEPLVAALKGTNYQTREGVTWAFYELKEPRAIEPLIEFLRVENIGDWGAEKALGAIGEPSVGPLIVAFQSTTNSHFLKKAARALGELKDSRAVAPLLDAFTVKDTSAPWTYAEALEKIGGPEAVDGLVAALKSKNTGIKVNAAKTLGRLKDPRAVPALLVAMEDKDRSVRSEAVQALGEIGDSRAVDTLVKALTDEKLGVQGEATQALAKLNKGGSTEAMLRQYREAKGREERLSLLRALARTGEPTVNLLIESLKDEDAEIRKLALQMLSFNSQGYVVSEKLTDASRERAQQAILDYYEAGKAEDLPYPERVSILAGIKEARATRLVLQTLKNKGEGYENAPWYVPQDVYIAFEKAGPYSVEPLLQALNDPDVNIRGGAAAMLGHIPISFHGAGWETNAARILERLGKVGSDAKEDEAVREKAIWAISRAGTAQQAPVILAVLKDKAAPLRVRCAAARAFAGEKLQDRSVTESLMAVFRDKSENQFLRVETAGALRGFEHKYQDGAIAAAFKTVRLDRTEPASLRAVARTTQELLAKVKAQNDNLQAFKPRPVTPGSELPHGKKIWPKGKVKERYDIGERILVEGQAEGARSEIKAWYDKQFADWKVYRDWNSREITVMMNGEWKVWIKSNMCCLVGVHAQEKNGSARLIHAFDGEEELQEFLGEIPEEVAHREKCKRNLQSIEVAKGSATRKFHLNAGDAIETNQISDLVSGGLESLVCPDAGTYSPGAVGKPSRCSVHGTQMAMGRR